MAISITKPTVNGSANNWGELLNDALDVIVDGVNGTAGTTSPNLSKLTIGGSDVTGEDGTTAVTAAELSNAVEGIIVRDYNGDGVTMTGQSYLKFTSGTGVFAQFTDTSTGSASDEYDLELNLLADRRNASSTATIYDGQAHEYIFYDGTNGIMRFYTTGAEEMRLTGGGDLHVDGDIIAYSSTVSDKRLKTNVHKIDGALEKVSKLNGYTFDYIRDNRASAGVIAQEVEKVLPSAVIEKDESLHGKDGETYKTVQYDQLHGLLIEAIKELKAEIEALKNGG